MLKNDPEKWGISFFSKLKALRDQGLRGRGSKKIKYER